MNITIPICAVLTMAAATAAQKPRVFITASRAVNVSNEAEAGAAKSAISFNGGDSPRSLDVIKSFTQLCPEVIVTANREKADYVVRLDHQEVGPTTPFIRGNKVAVFNKDSDLVYTSSTRVLASAVKGVCGAITGATGFSRSESPQPEPRD